MKSKYHNTTSRFVWDEAVMSKSSFVELSNPRSHFEELMMIRLFFSFPYPTNVDQTLRDTL